MNTLNFGFWVKHLSSAAFLLVGRFALKQNSSATMAGDIIHASSLAEASLFLAPAGITATVPPTVAVLARSGWSAGGGNGATPELASGLKALMKFGPGI